MRQRIIVFQLLLTLALSAPAMLRAQAVGAITGTVTDPSGAVIPGVKVTATRVETGISQSTVTSSAGTYTIPSLVVGTYNVTAEAGGFKTGTASGITLDVGPAARRGFQARVGGSHFHGGGECRPALAEHDRADRSRAWYRKSKCKRFLSTGAVSPTW